MVYLARKKEAHDKCCCLYEYNDLCTGGLWKANAMPLYPFPFWSCTFNAFQWHGSTLVDYNACTLKRSYHLT